MAAGNTLTDPSGWFREIIVPRIEQMNKVEGDYLSGTMMPADEEGGSYKFPIGTGSLTTYKLSGAIQPVQTSGVGIDYVTVTPDDYEVATYLRQQDLSRVGPAMETYVAQEVNKAVSKRKDWIKLDALQAFMTVGTPPQTIGNGAGDIIDIIDIEQLTAEFEGYGYNEPIFCPIPAMWMSQLCLYEEFAHADWQGPADLPMSKATRVTKRTWHNVNLMVLPDEYFARYAPAGGTALYTWAWCRSAMGAHAGPEMKNPSASARQELEGTPLLLKGSVSGAAIGINPNGVRRLSFAKQTTLTRPA